MKNTLDILGMPVISIQEGVEIGTVKGCLVDAAKRALAGLVIEDGKWFLGAKVLPFSDIVSFGDNILLVDRSTNVVPVEPDSNFANLFTQDVRIIGTKVLTRQGIFQGEVSEYFFAEDGALQRYEVAANTGGTVEIAAEQVITLSKDMVIIEAVGAEAMRTPIVPAVEEPIVAAPNATPVADEGETEEASKKFDEKQRKFLLGKKATRRIETDNGVIIVDEGKEITEEVLQKAKLAGKFVELSMSI